jgi:hypothetical protein
MVADGLPKKSKSGWGRARAASSSAANFNRATGSGGARIESRLSLRVAALRSGREEATNGSAGHIECRPYSIIDSVRVGFRVSRSICRTRPATKPACRCSSNRPATIPIAQRPNCFRMRYPRPLSPQSPLSEYSHIAVIQRPRSMSWRRSPMTNTKTWAELPTFHFVFAAPGSERTA